MVDAAKIQAAMPEYPIDEIFYTQSGSQAVTASLFVTNTTVAHTAGKAFYWKMRFSADQTTWYQEGFPQYYYNGTVNLYIPQFYVLLYITATDLKFTFGSVDVDRTLYWELVGYNIE